MGDLVAVNQVVLLQEVLGALKGLVNAATKHETHMASCNVRLDIMEVMLRQQQQQQSIQTSATADLPNMTAPIIASGATVKSPKDAKHRLFHCPFAGCDWQYNPCSAASGVQYVAIVIYLVFVISHICTKAHAVVQLPTARLPRAGWLCFLLGFGCVFTCLM